MTFANTIRPFFKYCYYKKALIKVNECTCINRCKIPIYYYTNLMCDLTNFNQKIGDCKCENKCSKYLINDNIGKCV